MKNWDTLEADRVKLLTKHFTPGRKGENIKFIVVHHNAGNLSIDGIWDVWQSRAASAHYQVTDNGQIGQLVWDRDTAWHAADSLANRRSIGIEHANSSSPTSRITSATLENGAHLVGALCRRYNLGRPKWLVNVFPHKNFTSTTCPGHIATDQREEYMSRAGYWYDQMAGKHSNTTARPVPAGLAVDGRLGHATVTALQRDLNARGAGIAVDGRAGHATWRALQADLGTPADGIVSHQSYQAHELGNGITQGWEFTGRGSTGSTMVRALQKRLDIPADGIWFEGTTAALQKHLN